MNNQEYIFSQQHSLEWMRKCQFLDNLKKSQEMKKYEDQVVQTMLDILKNNLCDFICIYFRCSEEDSRIIRICV